MKTKLKTPISYYGGKQSMVSKILPLIPEHTLYVEPFVGGGAIYWAKPKSGMEVVNDMNGHLVAFYRTIKSNFHHLRRLVLQTPSSRSVHREANEILKNSNLYDDLIVAWAVWTSCNMGFASQMYGTYGYGREIGCVRKVQNKKIAFLKNLSKRLDFTDIECNDAIKVITSRDCESAFFYVDPPYFNSNCGHYSGYSENDFKNLLEVLSNIKGKFLLSSYPSEVLAEFTSLKGWKTITHTKSIVACKGDRSKTKTEVLTMNY